MNTNKTDIPTSEFDRVENSEIDSSSLEVENQNIEATQRIDYVEIPEVFELKLEAGACIRFRRVINSGQNVNVFRGVRGASEELEPRTGCLLTEPYYLSDTALTIGQAKGLHSADYHLKDAPLTNISPRDAVRVCDTLTEKYLKGRQDVFRDWSICLPSEAQWEYACNYSTSELDRFEESSLFQASKDWYLKNGIRLTSVAERPPNELGLYDMLGVVVEFCRDSWENFVYRCQPDLARNPVCLGMNEYSAESSLSRFFFEMGTKSVKNWQDLMTSSGPFYDDYKCVGKGGHFSYRFQNLKGASSRVPWDLGGDSNYAGFRLCLMPTRGLFQPVNELLEAFDVGRIEFS